MKTVMLNGVEYPLSKACSKAHVSPGAVRQSLYTRHLTPQEAFDEAIDRKKARLQKLADSPTKLPAAPYEKWEPKKPDLVK